MTSDVERLAQLLELMPTSPAVLDLRDLVADAPDLVEARGLELALWASAPHANEELRDWRGAVALARALDAFNPARLEATA